MFTLAKLAGLKRVDDRGRSDERTCLIDDATDGRRRGDRGPYSKCVAVTCVPGKECPAYAPEGTTCPAYASEGTTCPVYAPEGIKYLAYARDRGCAECVECAVADAECPLYDGGCRDGDDKGREATCDYVVPDGGGGGGTTARPVSACTWDEDRAVVEFDSGCPGDVHCGASGRSTVGLIGVLRKFH